MKKMLRTVSALLFASSLVLSLSACAGAKSETAAQSEVLRTIPETNAPTAAPETTAAETTAAPETKAAETDAAPETTAAPETSAPETAGAPETSAEETESAAPEDAPVTHIHAYLKSESVQDFDRDPWKQFASMTAVYPLLSEEDEALYPELAKALKDSMEQETAENAESFRELSKMAREYLQEGEAPYEDMTKAEVVRADSNAFSVRFFNYSYEGGVHGYYFNYGRTFDPATGKLLKLDDVVTDLERLKEIIIPLLREKYEGDVIDGLEETFAQYDADSFCWNLTPAGLDLYFNPYDIAAFASGQQFLTLTFADHPDLFKEPFAKSTDAHIIPINTEAAVRAITYDLGHDGSTNEILVLPELSSDNNDAYIGYTVRIDDKDFRLAENDSWYYSTPAMYLIHTADGGDFLWLFLQTDNDYVYLDVVNLAEGKAVYAGSAGLMPCMSYTWDEESYDSTEIIDAYTDPAMLRLMNHCDVLSTYHAYKSFRIGKDGMPEGAAGDLYLLPDNAERVLTLNKDYSAEEISESGESLGKIDLPKGAKLRIVRTDGLDFADLQTEDGHLVRVTLDRSEGWASKTADGEELFALFDGMMFAG